MSPQVEPPVRTHADFISNSSRWAHVKLRSGDIIVTTPPKSGTTWLQGILALLLSGDPNVTADISMKAPWIDMEFRDIKDVTARIDAQDHRRHLKSHAPLDCLPSCNEVSYITVYRHPLDVYFSYMRHYDNIQVDLKDPLAQGPLQERFERFLEADAGHVCLRSIVSHFKSTVQLEPRANVLRLHYKDMLRDLPHAFGQITKLIDVDHDAGVMNTLIEAARFDKMRANSDRFAPSAGQGFWKNDKNFFDSATSNKWDGKLTDAELAAYDFHMSQLLHPVERRWLEWGSDPVA
ncbi:MAG: sulfotransferase domain-containing protein [Pelagimonas sp.]|uniref:sulfotransferase domain-containing protein n=1 Tax=Pelagimonas sp. TaxID=2073170 RepID=UPI003D6BFFA3